MSQLCNQRTRELMDKAVCLHMKKKCIISGCYRGSPHTDQGRRIAGRLLLCTRKLHRYLLPLCMLGSIACCFI